jgi:hypothetical protein
MKRAIGLIIILLCVAGCLYIWRDTPFVPVLGTIFFAFAVVLLAIFLFSRDLITAGGKLLREALSPVIEENYHVSVALSNRFESTERALNDFASAMQQYARHMASHTHAIQGLSQASQSLRYSAAEQNHILHRLTKTLKQERTEREVSKIEWVVNEMERRTLQALQVKDELENKTTVSGITPGEVPPLVTKKIQSPPGCVVSPKALYKVLHYTATWRRADALSP